MRKIYTTDLSDAEWACLKDHLPASKLPGKMRTHALREIFNAIFFYVLKSGCPWRLLPGDFPPWQTVFYHFRTFRLSGLWFLALKALRAAERKRNGKAPNPLLQRSWTPSASRPQRSRRARTATRLIERATMPTNTSRTESAISWWTP
jgi:transposase